MSRVCYIKGVFSLFTYICGCVSVCPSIYIYICVFVCGECLVIGSGEGARSW